MIDPSRYCTLFLAAIAAVVLLSGGDPLKGADPDVPRTISQHSGLFVGDVRIQRALRAAKELERLDRPIDALITIQKVLDEPAHKFVLDDARKLNLVRDLAEAFVCEELTGGVELYRQHFEDRAAALVQQARQKNDVHQLRQVSLRFFLTRAGGKATMDLASRALDRGRADQALRHLQRLADSPAHAEIRTAPFHLKRLVAQTMLGMEQAARESASILQGDERGMDLSLEEITSAIQHRPEQLFLQGRSAESELMLLRLARSDNRQVAARSLQTLATMSRRLGCEEDAHYFESLRRSLGGPHRFVAPIDRLRSNVDDENVTTKLEVRKSTGPSLRPIPFARPPKLPFFRRHLLFFDDREVTAGLSLWNLETGKNDWQLPVTVRNPRELGECLKLTTVGHLLFVTTGDRIVALSSLRKRKLWSRRLAGDCVTPVLADVAAVIVRAGKTLFALDPLTGATMWSVDDVGEDLEIIGDEQCLVAMGTKEFVAYHPVDGLVMRSGRFAFEVDRYIQGVFGRKLLLVVMELKRGGLVARLWDPWTDKDSWSHVFKLGTRYFRGVDGHVAFLEPRGQLVVLHQQTGEVVVSDQLPRSLANRTSRVEVFSHAQNLFVGLDVKPTLRAPPKSLRSPAAHWLDLTGNLRAYDLAKQRLMWRRDVADVLLLARPGKELPALVQLSRSEEHNRAASAVELISKHTGRTIGRHDLSVDLEHPLVMLDSAAHTVKLIGRRHTGELTITPNPAR